MNFFIAKPKYMGIKRVFLSLVGVMLTGNVALFAQTITGTWQGTLPSGDNPRIVLKIVKSDDGSLRGGLIRIDRSPDAMPLSSVNFVAPNLSVDQIYAGFGFQGKLSADGKSMEGTWTQDKQTFPLTLFLAAPDALWKHDGPEPLRPMAAAADPAFEVATIKLSPPDSKETSIGWRTRHFTATSNTVLDLVKFAYNMRGRQISGGPPWMSEMKFDIAGEPDAEGLPSEDQYHRMVQKLLADRFHLKFHTIQQIFPVYALTLGTSPLKVTKSDLNFNGRGSIYVKEQADGQTLVQFAGHTMASFDDLLMNFIQDRQIVDETGLTGLFDITLTFPTSALQGSHGSGPEDERANAFIQALQAVGFKLLPKKEPLDVIVIDHIEQPSPN